VDLRPPGTDAGGVRPGPISRCALYPAEKAYDKWRARNPAINSPEFKGLPSGSVTPVSYSTVSLDMQHSLKDAEAVALKSAFGACTLAYGPEFPASDFAAAMRAAQGDPFDPQRQVTGRMSIHGAP
jgi:hypothetical protein